MAGGVHPAQAYAAALRGAKVPRTPKFNNRKVKVEGRMFDSQKEARRWFDLSCLERVGEITGLVCQPKFEFVHNGVRIGSYKPDFSYYRNGARVIEDVKSDPTKTQAYLLRKKLLLAFYGLEVVET